MGSRAVQKSASKIKMATAHTGPAASEAEMIVLSEDNYKDLIGGQNEQNEVAIPKKKIPFWDIDPGTQRSTAKKIFIVLLIIMILFFLVLKCYEIFLNT